MESVTKDRDIRLVKSEKRRNYLVSETGYNANYFLSKNIIATEIKKIKFS